MYQPSKPSFIKTCPRDHGLVSNETLYRNRLRKSVYIILCLIGAFSINMLCMYLYYTRGISLQSVSVIMQLFLFAVFSAGLAILPYHRSHYGLNLNNVKRNVIIGFFAGLFFIPLMVAMRISLVRRGYSQFAFRPVLVPTDFVYPFIALIQETIIKGFFQSYFVVVFEHEKHNRLISIILSSYIFAQFHIMYSIPLFIGTFVFAFITGWIYEKERSIVSVTIMHWMAGAALLSFCVM
ncbi:MAG: CPBP family intramembrane glutamic endopeptidase [Spirochaetota bacterium]